MSEPGESSPNSRFGTISIILMFVPVLAIALLSFVFEPIVSDLSNNIQRMMMVLTLLLPALLGFLFAIVGLVKKEHRKWIYVIGLIINLLESLYFGLLVLLAG
jgi:Na+/melibiose symporter-like transporter